MKLRNIITSLMAILMVFATVSFAGGKDETKKVTREGILSNLLIGIQSENEGLRVSSAYYLGEYKAQEAVIPLLKILRNDKSDGARIVAALSLMKIGNPQGVYMVKRTAKFNTSERTRNMSEKFYYSSLLKKYIEENPSKAGLYSFLSK